jgi:hypothetical protein
VEKKRSRRILEQVNRFPRFPQGAIEPEIILLSVQHIKYIKDVYVLDHSPTSMASG